MFEWRRITFLESVTNLKPLLRAATGKSPSSTVAREITVCLQQGRLFFQSAEQSAIEIRPLLFFYGTMAFAKAVIISRQLKALATLPHGHGIKDISHANASIEDATVRILLDGTFQRFNDAVAPLIHVMCYDRLTVPQRIPVPAVLSDQLKGLELTLRQILSRIPELGKVYRQTFAEPPGTEIIVLSTSLGDAPDYWTLQVSEPRLFAGREELASIVGEWRPRFPVLRRWRLANASRAWGTQCSCSAMFKYLRTNSTRAASPKMTMAILGQLSGSIRTRTSRRRQ
jgi:hypothetical protein